MGILINALVGLISGIFGSMGLGGGSMLIIYLTLVENVPQSLAQGINLIFFIPMALTATLLHIKDSLIDKKLVIPAMLTGILGAAIGSFLTSYIDNKVLGKLFGILLIYMGIMQFYKIKVSIKTSNKKAREDV